MVKKNGVLVKWVALAGTAVVLVVSVTLWLANVDAATQQNGREIIELKDMSKTHLRAVRKISERFDTLDKRQVLIAEKLGIKRSDLPD